MSLLGDFHGNDQRAKIAALLHSLMVEIRGQREITGHEINEVVWALAEVVNNYGIDAMERTDDLAGSVLEEREGKVEEVLWSQVYGILDEAALKIQKQEGRASDKVHKLREAAKSAAKRKKVGKGKKSLRLTRAQLDAITKAAKARKAKKKATKKKATKKRRR